MNQENSFENLNTPPKTPVETKAKFPQETQQFLIALSPQRPILIKRNAQTFLENFHKAASKMLENMKNKYVKELKLKDFKGGIVQRLEEFNARIKEVDKLINEKKDISLGIEIMTIALNWLHPFNFKLSDGKISIFYQEASEMTAKGMELLALGYYKMKNYEECIKYSKLSLGLNPNQTFIIKILYSAYAQNGDTNLALQVLNSDKNNRNVNNLKIENEKEKKQMGNKILRCLRKNSYSLTSFLLSGIFTFILTKYLLKFPEKDSLIFSLGASLISYLTTNWFINLKAK